MAFRSAEAVINELADRYAQALFFSCNPELIILCTEAERTCLCAKIYALSETNLTGFW
jgi:hypothetical protein